MRPEERPHRERAGYARDDHRAERADRERPEHLLEREKRAGERRVERGSNARAGPTPDENLEPPLLEAEPLPDERPDARAQHGRRAFAAGRPARAYRDC